MTFSPCQTCFVLVEAGSFQKRALLVAILLTSPNFVKQRWQTLNKHPHSLNVKIDNQLFCIPPLFEGMHRILTQGIGSLPRYPSPN
ncbi:hypothetical protein THIOSC13_1040007 [uncultured Thiomicrorhabdus sp.]